MAALPRLRRLAGVAALLPLGRLAVGRWAGLTAMALCLLTGYLYGSLFFTPIDVPFLAAMTWATLAIVVMTRQVLPSWRATIGVGLLTGLAIATRTGGIITHAYLFGAMALCAAEFFATHGRVTLRYLMQIGARYAAVIVIAWMTAVALWPWLQIGNPFQQFKIALVHFATIPMTYEFSHWGERIWTSELPASYIPGQLLARLPEAFLLLLVVAFVSAVASGAVLVRDTIAGWRLDRGAGLRAAALTLARQRAILIVCGCRCPAAWISDRSARDHLSKFELDYWSLAATEALRRLERRLDYDPAVRAAESPPSILIRIPWREQSVDPTEKTVDRRNRSGQGRLHHRH